MKTKQLKTKHPLYETWKSMRQRCNNPNHTGFQDYGGRGISVCAAWELDFWAFVRDVGPKPTPQHSLDRIDNDENYAPHNVRWATKWEQNLNSRKVKEAKGYFVTGGKFVAQINADGRQVYLGRFDCPLMARLAYEDALAKKLAGEEVK